MVCLDNKHNVDELFDNLTKMHSSGTFYSVIEKEKPRLANKTGDGKTQAASCEKNEVRNRSKSSRDKNVLRIAKLPFHFAYELL